MNEMRKLLNLMESATEEVSEGFFSPKVSQEEFYAQLNDMLKLIEQQGEIDDLHNKRLSTVMDMVKAQQETILALSETLERNQEVTTKLIDAMGSIQDRIMGDDSPPDGNTPPTNNIH